MDRAQVESLLNKFAQSAGSDLYLTVDHPPCSRMENGIRPMSDKPLSPEDLQSIADRLLNPAQQTEFLTNLELNTALHWDHKTRFRINVFRQRLSMGMVIRRIRTDIPSLESLGLPPICQNLIMEKRGLVLVVGPSGAGKSTTIAAMLDYRNRHGDGHVVTVEDPVEFLHAHKGCLFTQRDLGIDTFSFDQALKNVLRQRPDIVVIGEIRDRQTMEHAINFSETGHLCLATLHANNASQAIKRILSFFPEEIHRQMMLNLSLNLRGILSQRLVPNRKETRSLIMEILLNEGLAKALIEEGKIRELHELMEKNSDIGMRTFDQCLFDLVVKGEISEEAALAEADNAANLQLQIRQRDTSQKLARIGNKPLAPSRGPLLSRPEDY